MPDIVSRKICQMINQGEVEPTKIGKTVLVIDEAQDMGKEYDLVNALIANNEEMRVIAVGDDDQTFMNSAVRIPNIDWHKILKKVSSLRWLKIIMTHIIW